MAKWIFQKISGDQQGVSLIEENFNIGLAAQVAQKQKSCITKCNTDPQVQCFGLPFIYYCNWLVFQLKKLISSMFKIYLISPRICKKVEHNAFQWNEIVRSIQLHLKKRFLKYFFNFQYFTVDIAFQTCIFYEKTCVWVKVIIKGINQLYNKINLLTFSILR